MRNHDKDKKKAFFKKSRSSYLNKTIKFRDVKNLEDVDDLPLTSNQKAVGVCGYSYISNAARRYLSSKVGQKWDDIYSELINRFGESVKKDLDFYIDLNAYVKDGEIWHIAPYCGESRVSYGFYVLSSDGILREVPRKRSRVKWSYFKNPEDRVKYKDGLIIFKHNNLHYKAPISEAFTEHPLDFFTRFKQFEKTSLHLKFFKDGKTWYIKTSNVRQLNKKEKKIYGLPTIDINQ